MKDKGRSSFPQQGLFGGASSVGDSAWGPRDPYRYPERTQRTGESAINDRFTHKIPPKWGPEMQSRYSFNQWKDDIAVWEMVCDVQEDRRGPLVMTQLTGVASAHINDWISRKSPKRLLRIKFGSCEYRNDEAPLLEEAPNVEDGAAAVRDAAEEVEGAGKGRGRGQAAGRGRRGQRPQLAEDSDESEHTREKSLTGTTSHCAPVEQAIRWQ